MSQMFSTQTAFQDGVVKIAGRYRNFVVSSLRDSGLKLHRFEQQFPDRFHDFGFSAGACIVGSAGMTVRGKVPFICGSAILLASRCYEYIRNSICHPHVNVKLIGTQSGFSLSHDGGSVQACEDLALMRALPQMKVFSPTDYWETIRILEFVAGDYGPAYIRLSGVEVPEIYDQSFVFHPSQGSVLQEGHTVVLCATGTMVSAAMATAKILVEKGISTAVVAFTTLKPFDGSVLDQFLPRAKLLVAVEEHSVIGGLGSAVLEFFHGKLPCVFHRIGVPDCFGESGVLDDLYRVTGLTPETIGAQIQKLL